MRVMSIVGARPQSIKAAPVCRALRREHQETLVRAAKALRVPEDRPDVYGDGHAARRVVEVLDPSEGS